MKLITIGITHKGDDNEKEYLEIAADYLAGTGDTFYT
jgi:hypothetical protein